jgi:hypothetical protein
MSQCKVQIVSALLLVDSVHQSCADVPTRYKAQATMGLYHRVSAFEHRERIASRGLKSWRLLGDAHFPRLAPRIFPSLELRKTRGMPVDFSGLMAGEPYIRRWPDCWCNSV